MAAPTLSTALQESLRSELAGCVERAGQLKRIQWLALRWPALGDALPDPLAFFAHSSERDRFYWEQPAAGAAIFAEGAMYALEVAGADRLAEASRLAQSLFADLRVVGEEAPDPSGPLLVGGFAFDDRSGEHAGRHDWQDFPSGRLVLPERVLVVREGRAWWSLVHAVVPGARAEAEWDSLRRRLVGLTAPIDGAIGSASAEIGSPWTAEALPELGPEYRVRSDRPHARFCAEVGAAQEQMASGGLEKVVLARSLTVRHDGLFDLPRFLGTLRAVYPTCTLFAVDRGESAFVGATPERLVSLSEDHVETAALAGSAPRGRTPDQDRALGEVLRADPKERFEHSLVVRGIRESLAELCGPLEIAAEPALRAVEGIQHLETRICGRLREGVRKSATVLDLVACLHPTPAVGGWPRKEALEWIRAHEGLDRGWYAGPVGYLDAAGGGEFHVGLRAGLVRGGDARLFAGAGIVPDSTPAAELAETRLKLRALLAPLTEI